MEYTINTSTVKEKSKYDQKMPQLHTVDPIGTASANSIEFHGIGPQMYIEDLL